MYSLDPSALPRAMIRSSTGDVFGKLGFVEFRSRREVVSYGEEIGRVFIEQCVVGVV